MSNIKLIDGAMINLGLLTYMYAITFENKFEVRFCLGEYEIDGNTKYSTKEKAEARIKQILEKQNSKEIEI